MGPAGLDHTQKPFRNEHKQQLRSYINFFLFLYNFCPAYHYIDRGGVGEGVMFGEKSSEIAKINIWCSGYDSARVALCLRLRLLLCFYEVPGLMLWVMACLTRD